MGTIIHGFPGAGGGGGGASAMSDLTDVELTSLSDGNILVYNGTSSKWVNFALSLGTAAAKDSTSSITQGSTDLIESGSVYAALADKVDTSLVGAASGIAELDSSGKVPSSQLPSFVDDVIEVEDYNHLPITGESGKIYVTVDDNKTYRWTGSTYAEISESLALGETSSTAYRGDRGKTAYDHSQDSGRVTAAVTSGLYKVAATAQGHIASLTAVEKSDITGLGIPAQDTTYGVVSKTANGLAPQLPNETTTTKYLRQDGTWQVPPDHTYNFGGTTFYSGNSDNAEHNANNIAYNGTYYYTSNGPSTLQGSSTADGAIYAQAYSTSWVGQIAQDYRNGNLFVRGKNNGTWQNWKAVVSDDHLMGLNQTANKFLFNPLTRRIQVNKSTSAWDSQVYSSQGYVTGCAVTFKAAQINMAIMFGLDNNPTQDANYNTIDYCWYLQNNGGLSMYENGASISSISGHQSYAVNDEFRIEYSGGNVRYYHNGVLCRTVARAISGKLYVDSSFHGASGAVYDYKFYSIGMDASTTNGLTISLVT